MKAFHPSLDLLTCLLFHFLLSHYAIAETFNIKEIGDPKAPTSYTGIHAAPTISPNF